MRKKGKSILFGVALLVFMLGLPTTRAYAEQSVTGDQVTEDVTEDVTEGDDNEVRETYKITYNLIGGTNAKGNPESYQEGDTVVFANATRHGYTFLGWYKDASYKTKIKMIDETFAEDVVVYAKWEAVKYKISYQLNGGQNDRSNPASYTILSKKIVLKNPTRSGYYFTGWKVGNRSQSTIAAGATGNITFSAQWKKYDKSVYLTKNTKVYTTNSTRYKLEDAVKNQLYYSAGVTSGQFTAVMNVKTKKTGYIRTKELTTKKPTTNIVVKTKKHYDFVTMEKNLKELAKTYPQWMEVKSLGKSHDNRNLYYAAIGNTKAKKQMVVTVSMHAREYLNTYFVMEQIEHYMNNYKKKSGKISMTYEKLFNEVCLYIVPMVNPDGVQIAQYGANGINNKTLRASVKKMLKGTSYTNWKANARGVNLNRNFPTKFGVNSPSKKPNATTYAGKSGASEKETKAVIKLYNSLSNPVGSIAYHSMGNLADWNTNKKSKYYSVNKRMGEITKKLTGYRYPASDLAGGVGGTMGTWLSNGKSEMPNITIETGNVRCPLPYSYYNRLWKDNRYVIESLTKLFY
ncbi:MAG: M14 family zinc carboxypeptidase [bacterium]|nr:M14 family zinc carboxypeptidase [bacterium]